MDVLRAADMAAGNPEVKKAGLNQQALIDVLSDRVPEGGIGAKLLDFLDSLWTNTGAFHGSWADDEPDVEYTFYGLVALGHASV